MSIIGPFTNIIVFYTEVGAPWDCSSPLACMRTSCVASRSRALNLLPCLFLYPQMPCAWFETAVCACLVALQWSEGQRISSAMSWFQIAVIVLQVALHTGMQAPLSDSNGAHLAHSFVGKGGVRPLI